MKSYKSKTVQLKIVELRRRSNKHADSLLYRLIGDVQRLFRLFGYVRRHGRGILYQWDLQRERYNGLGNNLSIVKKRQTLTKIHSRPKNPWYRNELKTRRRRRNP